MQVILPIFCLGIKAIHVHRIFNITIIKLVIYILNIQHRYNAIAESSDRFIQV